MKIKKRYVCTDEYMRTQYLRYINPGNKHKPKDPLTYEQYRDKNFLYYKEEAV